MNSIYNPYRIDIVLDEECNLSCTNCISKQKKTAPYYDYSSILDEIINNSNSSVSLIHFTGGEPFLKIDLLKKIINDIKSKKKIVDFINYSVYSNLTILNEQIINVIKENNIEIHTSIDGLQIQNDNIRGKGTFQKINENINKISRENIKLSSITTTLKDDNFDEITKDFLVWLKKESGNRNFDPPLKPSSPFMTFFLCNNHKLGIR